MQSTLTPQGLAPEEADPHDIFVIEPETLKEDRVALAARVDPSFAAKPAQDNTSAVPKQISAMDIMGDILSRPSTPKPRLAPDFSAALPAQPAKGAPPVDIRFRATAATADAIANEIKSPGEINIPDDVRLDGARSSRGAWAKRAAFGFLFALCSVAAAEAWDRYGDTARQMLAEWTPALALPSSQPAAAAPTTAAQPAEPAAQAAVADQAPSPPAPAALQSAPDSAAPAAAAPATPPPAATASPSAQQLQSMTQDIAQMGQQIEALKASIAQLKAGQEQMTQQISRDIVKNAVARNAEGKALEARTAERPHVPARPVPPARRPPRTAYSPAAMNVPPPYPAPPPPGAAPMQVQPPMETEAPDGGPVVRPPMPLH